MLAEENLTTLLKTARETWNHPLVQKYLRKTRIAQIINDLSAYKYGLMMSFEISTAV